MSVTTVELSFILLVAGTFLFFAFGSYIKIRKQRFEEQRKQIKDVEKRKEFEAKFQQRQDILRAIQQATRKTTKAIVSGLD